MVAVSSMAQHLMLLMHNSRKFKSSQECLLSCVPDRIMKFLLHAAQQSIVNINTEQFSVSIMHRPYIHT